MEGVEVHTEEAESAVAPGSNREGSSHTLGKGKSDEENSLVPPAAVSSGTQGTAQDTAKPTSVPPIFSGGSSSRSSQQYLHIGHTGYAPLTASKSSLNKLLSGSSLSESDQSRTFKLEGRLITTPRRGPRNNNHNMKVGVGARRTEPADVAPAIVRSCDQHCFLTDITDVRQMEQGLLQLLDDFHSGKIQAFGKDCTLEKMENVRKQQERLARLHFDLNAKQEMFSPKSEEGQRLAKENLSKLIENLQQLSISIEQLQTGNPGIQTDV